MIDLPPNQLDVLLSRLEELKVTEPLTKPNTNGSRFQIPKPNTPHSRILLHLRKCKKIDAQECESLALKALKKGDTESFHILRQRYYELTGFWF